MVTASIGLGWGIAVLEGAGLNPMHFKVRHLLLDMRRDQSADFVKRRKVALAG
jgi:hypothetical protein